MDVSLALALAKGSGVCVVTGELFADGFGSLGMVDDANATNLDTSEAGYLKPGTSSEVYSAAADLAVWTSASANAQGGCAARIRIPASLVAVGGDRVKVSIKASANGAVAWTGMYIGHAGAGSAFDGTQVPVLFSGAGFGSVAAGSGVAESDAVVYAVDETKDLIISIGFASTSSVTYGANTGVTTYTKSAAAGDAGSTSVSGYATSSNTAYAVDLVRVRTSSGSSGNMSVASEVIPVAFEPAAISGELHAVPVDALTINEDIMLDVSRDAGNTWTEVALSLAFPPFGGTHVLRFPATDVSGTPSGDEPRYRLRGENGKLFKVPGIALEFHE